MASYRNGKAHENSIDSEGVYIVVNSKFVSTDGEVIKKSNEQIEPLFKNELAFVLSDVPNGRAIARTFLVPKDGLYTLNQRIAGITPSSNTCPYFLHILMNRNKYFLAFDDGAKQTNLSVKDVLEFEANYPNFKEQERIGALFDSLDVLITLHQRECDQLVNIKKALLEKMFPSENEYTPRIRFRGFTDAWEQREVNEIADRYDNLRVPVASSQRVEGTTPYYGANGIQDYVDGYTHEGEFVLVAEDGANDLKNYPVQYVNGRIWVNNHAHVLQSNQNNDTKFLKYLIGSTNIENLLVGGGRAKLNAEVLMKIDLTLPEKQEQIKISSLFDSLDSLITLHQRECDQLVNIKKALLEKMFPSENEYTPRIRFRGFTDAWEQREVNEIADRYDNLRVPVASSQRVEGTTPYYGANGIQDYVDGYTHEGEFVLVAEDGANDLKNYPVQYVNGRIWVNNHAHVLQSNQNNDTKFLKYLIGSTNIENLLVGGGRAKLNAEVLMKIDLTLPEKQEQIKISSLFDSLDSLITLHQRKCEKLKNIKKSLLEKMFA